MFSNCFLGGVAISDSFFVAVLSRIVVWRQYYLELFLWEVLNRIILWRQFQIGLFTLQLNYLGLFYDSSIILDGLFGKYNLGLFHDVIIVSDFMKAVLVRILSWLQ
jgi:hypothetical protein